MEQELAGNEDPNKKREPAFKQQQACSDGDVNPASPDLAGQRSGEGAASLLPHLQRQAQAQMPIETTDEDQPPGPGQGNLGK